MNGHFNRFTTDKLLDFLKRLDRKVTIQISPHQPGEPYQEVGFGLTGIAALRLGELENCEPISLNAGLVADHKSARTLAPWSRRVHTARRPSVRPIAGTVPIRIVCSEAL